MRVTSSMYYDNLFSPQSSKLEKKLFDVNRQISSGLKIQYASDDVPTFVETMKLDNEITTLGQVKKSTESASKVSTQTDAVMNEFADTFNRMKVLFVNAANASNSNSSRNAISDELKGLKDHLRNLSNTSINGQYLFSGSAIDTKPIAEDGTYKGNDKPRKAFLGSNVKQQYNLPGSQLFLGEEQRINRTITSNVPNYSLTAQYPDFTDTSITGTENVPITSSSTVRDLMGDTDNSADNVDNHFYLRGTKSDGTAFSQEIKMKSGDKISELLKNIGDAYGNTANLDVVDVSLNNFGEIKIKDKMQGSSKLDFNLVAAVDFDQADGNDAADISDGMYSGNQGKIDNLKDGETNFKSILTGTSTAYNTNLYVKSFTQSPYDAATTYDTFKSAKFAMSRAVEGDGTHDDTLSITVNNGDGTTKQYDQRYTTDAATTYDNLKNQIEADGDYTVSVVDDTITLNVTAHGAANNVSIDTDLSNDNGSGAGAVNTDTSKTYSVLADDIYSILYDRTEFAKQGSTLSSNVSQIVKDTNAFATPSTLISEVADLSQGKAGTLDGTQFKLSGKNVSGTAYNVQIDLNSTAHGGSTFSLDGGSTNYSIFDMNSPRAAVDADKMTYQQLMDVVNMVVTNNLPANSSPAETADEHDTAISSSKGTGNTVLSYDGKLTFEQLNSSDTKASISLYDIKSGDFSATLAPVSVMAFNTNNALTIRDPKTDFFKTVDKMITSVEEYKEYPDATSGDKRGIGIENAIQMIDDLSKHVSRSHSIVGAQSNSLTRSLDRTQLLEISTKTLRSSVVDTDIAEASMTLSKLSLNYQAMLSTVGKVSKLSLVNYL